MWKSSNADIAAELHTQAVTGVLAVVVAARSRGTLERVYRVPTIGTE